MEKNTLKIRKSIKKTTSKKQKLSKPKKSAIVKVDGIEISHPNKIVYPDCGITKMQVIEYYKAVEKRMFKLIGNRLISAVRCHNGLSCFYKKHPTVASTGIDTIQVDGKSGKDDYFFISSKSGIIAQAQLGTLEFHCWASHVDSLEYPDIMVFDLDPDVDLDLKQIRQGVKDLKRLLDDLNLISFLKTSGGKGYHIVVPFTPTVDWEKFSNFARGIALALEQKYPSRYTSNIRKATRKGKIFIDWERNTRAQTSVAPYSLRARAGAKVSMPISWRDLNKISPNDIDIFKAQALVKKKDPWANFFKIKQHLK